MGCINLKDKQGRIIERTEIVKDYLKDITKYEVLTQREEEELFKRIKAGDSSARNKIIESNQRFVFALAKCYSSKGNLMDLVDEGNIGMMQAIDNYDPKLGNRFLSHAVWYIRRRINSYLINEGLLIRKSNNAKTGYKLGKVKSKFFNEYGRYPSTDELVDYFKEEYGMEIKDKSDLYDVNVRSINTTFDDNDSTAFENSAFFTGKTNAKNEYTKEINNEYLRELVKSALSGLSERDRAVMKMSYGIGYNREYSSSEIGEILNLTGERVRQIRKEGEKKLKAIFSYSLNKNI